MRSVKRLPEAIHNPLRSGVVVYDLTRIVEELVFNSLDAGSTKVSVAVGVGNYYVQVDDNGSGITREGLLLLGERYATSKIDHFALMDTGGEYLNFHGESLCSISDVSLLEVVTKTRGKPNGYRKIMKNSKCVFLGINNDRRDVGTTVTVRDIFYNQPVRRKHMEYSPKKVLDSIKMSVLRIALVHVNISFKVLDVESSNELLRTGTSSSPLPILFSYFGIEESATFYKLNMADGELKLAGYISDPREVLSPKAIQYVYINSRFVHKGPIHKLLNQLAATMRPENEKRIKCDMSPMFILNLLCPRCYYDVITSEWNSVEFKDWGPVLALIETGVMRLWAENVSPVLPVASDKDMPDTFGRGKKRCRKKLCDDYDNMRNLEGWVSPYGELSRKSYEPNKNSRSTDLLSEMEYLNTLRDGSVSGCRVTANKRVRFDPSPHAFDEDNTPSALENTLREFNAKINSLPTLSGAVDDCLKFCDDVHLHQEPSGIFLKRCSRGRSLIRERNLRAMDDRFELGSSERKWIDCDDSMGDQIDLDMYERDLYHKEASPFQYFSRTQYDVLETLEFPIFDSVKENTSPDTYKLGRKWTSSWQCSESGWSPLTAEKNIGIKFLDVDETSYRNFPKLRSPQREGESFKRSSLNTKYGWLSHNGSFMNLSPDSKTANGEFDWGDYENNFSPKSFKRFGETLYSPLPSYGEESPRKYSVASPVKHECEEKPNVRNQNSNFDKKIFIRSHSAPPFHKRKKRYTDLTNSFTTLSTKNSFETISATLPLTERGYSRCRKLRSETKPLKCSQTSVGHDHPSPMERPILKVAPEVMDFENVRPQKVGHFVNIGSVECLDSTKVPEPLNTRWKWRNNFLPSAGGRDNKNDQDIILDISSDILHLAGDNPLAPKTIDRTSLEDTKVLNQIDEKFIAVVAGKNLAIIDQHAADERIRLEDLRRKVLSGEMKTITYLDVEQEMVLPEISYQLLQNYAAQIQSWGWICNIHSQNTSSFSKHLDFLQRQQTVVKLVAVPCILDVNLTDSDLLEFLEQLADTDGSSTIPPSVHRVLNNKACRGAIMFGDALLPSECSLIVEELKRTELCFQCAHGRPTTVPLVDLDILHNRISNLGSHQSWHGLRQHNKLGLERIVQNLISSL